jgi:hypothetical protein
MKLYLAIYLAASTANAGILDDIENRCLELEEENKHYNAEILALQDSIKNIDLREIVAETNSLNEELSDYPKKRDDESYEEMEERVWKAKNRLEALSKMRSEVTKNISQRGIIKERRNELLIEYKQLCL